MSNIIQDIDIIDRNSQEAMETVKTSKEENTGKTKSSKIDTHPPKKSKNKTQEN